MNKLIWTSLIIVLAGCSPDKEEGLVHPSVERRYSVSGETLKTEKDSLERIGIDTSKRVDIKEMIQKARKTAAQQKGK